MVMLSKNMRNQLGDRQILQGDNNLSIFILLPPIQTKKKGKFSEMVKETTIVKRHQSQLGNRTINKTHYSKLIHLQISSGLSDGSGKLAVALSD